MFELSRNEILGGDDFNHVYKNSHTHINREMVIHVLRDERYNGKVGFAAGKKLGCAVVRNRVKRLMREAYRLNKNKIRRDCAIILVGRKNLINVKFNVAIKSFLDVCRKAGILAE